MKVKNTVVVNLKEISIVDLGDIVSVTEINALFRPQLNMTEVEIKGTTFRLTLETTTCFTVLPNGVSLSYPTETLSILETDNGLYVKTEQYTKI